MTTVFAIVGAVSLLLSAWVGVAAQVEARQHLPLQFRDEMSSRYYMTRAFFDPSIPLPLRRRLMIGSLLGVFAFLCFAAAALLAGNGVLALLILLVCGLAAVNLIGQWRSARS